MTYKNRTRSTLMSLQTDSCWSCVRKISGAVTSVVTDAIPPAQSWTDSITDLVIDKSKPLDLSRRLLVKDCNQLKFKVHSIESNPDWYTRVVSQYSDHITTSGHLAIAALRDKTNGYNRYFSKTHSVGSLLPSISDIEAAYSKLDVGAFIGTTMLTDKNLLGFKTDLNILATIGELSEIRGLIDLMLPTRSLGSGINRILDPLTEKFLGYSFGLVPTYSDMLAIIQRIQRLDDSISKWNQQAGKGVVLNEHANIPLPDSLKTSPFLLVSDDGEPVKTSKGSIFRINKDTKVQKTSIRVSPQPGKYLTGTWRYSEYGTVYVKATASVYFKPLPLLTDSVLALQASIWGANKPLSAAWELVPFSFVVDWFISIGDAIDRFETEKTLLKLEVVDACFSTRIRRESIIETYMDLAVTPVKTLNCGGQVIVATSYKRNKIAPKMVQFQKYFKMEYSTPTMGQTVLGSALLWQLLCSSKTKVHRTSMIFG